MSGASGMGGADKSDEWSGIGGTEERPGAETAGGMDAVRAFTDQSNELVAWIGKAVASPKRLELLSLLSQAPRTVSELAEAGGTTHANASRHLQVLRAAGLIGSQREGAAIRYRLRDPEVSRFLSGLRALARRQLAELERLARSYLGEPWRLEPVDRRTLLGRVDAGEVVLLDVRPAEEYRASHLPGAISIPVPELEARLPELPREREVVAYCRGPYCLWASQAAGVLRERGFRARFLDEGVPEWRALGLPTEEGHAV